MSARPQPTHVGILRSAPVLGLSPADVAKMPAEAMPGLLVELGALHGAALAHLAAMPSRNGDRSPADGLITTEEAARMAGVTAEQFARRLVFKPALVKLGHRTTRVNEKRLCRILAEL